MRHHARARSPDGRPAPAARQPREGNGDRCADAGVPAGPTTGGAAGVRLPEDCAGARVRRGRDQQGRRLQPVRRPRPRQPDVRPRRGRGRRAVRVQAAGAAGHPRQRRGLRQGDPAQRAPSVLRTERQRRRRRPGTGGREPPGDEDGHACLHAPAAAAVRRASARRFRGRLQPRLRGRHRQDDLLRVVRRHRARRHQPRRLRRRARAPAARARGRTRDRAQVRRLLRPGDRRAAPQRCIRGHPGARRGGLPRDDARLPGRAEPADHIRRPGAGQEARRRPR